MSEFGCPRSSGGGSNEIRGRVNSVFKIGGVDTAAD